jgi:adhesin transport system membrane fusion protein
VELSFFNEIQEELARTTARVNALTETDSALTDRVNQTQIYSPVAGTVKQLYFNTRGGVISPSQEIAEIVPLDDRMLLEVKIQPRDIAFLRPGQETVVKFTAYDFVIYGGLKGVVDQIGADSIIDEEGNAFYNVTVRTTESFNRDDMPIIPGMVAEVDVLTGKKSVLNYLAKPILRAKQYALTER